MALSSPSKACSFRGQGLRHHTSHHHPSCSIGAPCFPLRLQIEMAYDSPPGYGRQSYRRKYRVRALAEGGAGPAKLKFKDIVDGVEKMTTVMQYYKDHHGLNLHPK